MTGAGKRIKKGISLHIAWKLSSAVYMCMPGLMLSVPTKLWSKSLVTGYQGSGWTRDFISVARKLTDITDNVNSWVNLSTLHEITQGWSMTKGQGFSTERLRPQAVLSFPRPHVLSWHKCALLGRESPSWLCLHVQPLPQSLVLRVLSEYLLRKGRWREEGRGKKRRRGRKEGRNDWKKRKGEMQRTERSKDS